MTGLDAPDRGSTPISLSDRDFLARAVQLGKRGWGQVHPNPMVGCVLVRDGVVLAEGWHCRYGGPHAEIEALDAARAAGHDAAGATAYVSLEPCRHEGKTPPCTTALLDAGVARVVYGAPDPSEHAGGGGDELRRAGIEVTGPVLTPAEARRENPAFFHDDPSRPWTLLKLAVSADGWIAARPGEQTRITGPEADARVHELRAGFDAILVGARTARADDPLLTVRGATEPRVPPRRVVLDPRGELPATARLFLHARKGDVEDAGDGGARGADEGMHGMGDGGHGMDDGMHGMGGEVLILTAQEAASDASPLPPNAGRIFLPLADDGRFSPAALMARLVDEGIRSLLCEGGGELGTSLLAADLVDRFVLIRSERSLGPGGVPAFPGFPAGWEPPAPSWSSLGNAEAVGEDRWFAWDRDRGASPPST